MHPSPLIMSFSCFVYSLHSLLGNNCSEIPSFWDLLPNIWLGRNLPFLADLSSKPTMPSGSFTVCGCLVKHIDSAWFGTICLVKRANGIKGDPNPPEKKNKERSTTSYIGSVFGTGIHLDSIDSSLVPFQCIREASSQKAHGPEIDPQFSSNCNAVNMPCVLLPSCHWMSLWCLQKADQELEGCNHLRQASQEVLPQNSQFWRYNHCINTFERWPHQHTL